MLCDQIYFDEHENCPRVKNIKIFGEKGEDIKTEDAECKVYWFLRRFYGEKCGGPLLFWGSRFYKCHVFLRTDVEPPNYPHYRDCERFLI